MIAFDDLIERKRVVGELRVSCDNSHACSAQRSIHLHAPERFHDRRNLAAE